MIGISMVYGETLQFRPSANNVLSVSVYAEVQTVNGISTKYPPIAQRIGYGNLPNSGADTTIVAAVPYNTYYGQVLINIANADSVNRTVRVYHVEDGGSPSTDNRLAYDATIPANGAMTINAQGISA